MSIIQYLRPTLFVRSIQEIPYEEYKKQGIKTLFFDLDNTVMSYDEKMISVNNIAFLEQLKKSFTIVIVSNSGYSRVSHACNHASIAFIHSAKKPFKSGYKKALKKASAQINTSLFIGDQLMTDILGASRMQLISILVKPLKQRSDHIFTRINRTIERAILKKISKKNPNQLNEALIEYGKEIHGLF
jgi:HAD superfamily phosphatase (TIGR01668 family)